MLQMPVRAREDGDDAEDEEAAVEETPYNESALKRAVSRNMSAWSSRRQTGINGPAANGGVAANSEPAANLWPAANRWPAADDNRLAFRHVAPPAGVQTHEYSDECASEDGGVDEGNGYIARKCNWASFPLRTAAL